MRLVGRGADRLQRLQPLVAAAPGLDDKRIYTLELSRSPNSADLRLLLNAKRDHVGNGESVQFKLSIKNLSQTTATGIELIILQDEALAFDTPWRAAATATVTDSSSLSN